MRCPDCHSGETMCDPARSGGACGSCGGAGRVALFEVPASAWPSAQGSVPDDGMWPCPACDGSGNCATCQGTGTLDDEAWEDSLVQPFFAEGRGCGPVGNRPH